MSSWAGGLQSHHQTNPSCLANIYINVDVFKLRPQQRLLEARVSATVRLLHSHQSNPKTLGLHQCFKECPDVREAKQISS